MIYLSTGFAIFMGIMVMIIRTKAAKRPVSVKKIILPPIFMSTGAFMFVFPFFRVTGLEFIEAIGIGFIFSIILIKTSNFEVRNNEIYLQHSKAFIFILLGLLIFRIIAKLVLSNSINIGQLGGMFWILAFGMIVPWRISMLYKFRRLQSEFSLKNV